MVAPTFNDFLTIYNDDIRQNPASIELDKITSNKKMGANTNDIYVEPSDIMKSEESKSGFLKGKKTDRHLTKK
jgi:hypothetical protein